MYYRHRIHTEFSSTRRPYPPSIFSIDNDEVHTAPFLQRIQLLGPGEAIVRATGQVDDGAMKNCISKKRWEGYGHCPLATRAEQDEETRGEREEDSAHGTLVGATYKWAE
ncbi:hypothetical protein B0H14DRAFT_3539497 [Mycena olivaceomarginata]|nr:hypothetical protein B0H14DRAFT_3539497 [Mycena olivaceomarginata]